MLKDSGRILKIWFTNEKYGVLLNDDAPLM